MDRIGTHLRNAALLSAVVLVALVAGELFTRLVAGPPAHFLFSGSFRDHRAGWDIVYGVDEKLRRVSCLEGDVTGRRRIAVIGDSFTYGQGVADCRNFAALLNRSQGKYVFENFGLIGSGPIGYHLVARDLVDESYDGALIVFYGNDFVESSDERSIVGPLADASSVFALLRKVKHRFQVWKRQREVERAIGNRSHLEVYNNVASMIKEKDPAYAQRCVEPDARLMEKFAVTFDEIIETLAAKVPREMIVVSMAPQGSVVANPLREFIVGLGGGVASFGEEGTAYREVRRLAKERGLRFVETFEAFLRDGDESYWPDDFHWTDHGHERMAELVGREFGGIPRPHSPGR